MKELAAAIAAHVDGLSDQPYLTTAIDGLLLLRSAQARPPSHRISRPALCVVAQGEKWTSFGSEQHHYRAGEALLVTVEMPSVGQVVRATPQQPFLGLVLELCPRILQEVLEQMAVPPGESPAFEGGARVIPAGSSLTDALTRLVRLLDRPQALPVVAPLVLREIGYELLAGEQGAGIAAMVLAHTRRGRIMQAIHLLRLQFARPLGIQALAAVAGLSPSAFHRQFKAVTSLTPIQYQKQLRLLEARRMMQLERVKAEVAAYATGYRSASQFSREYVRMFGCPPGRDAKATLSARSGQRRRPPLPAPA